MGPIAAAVTRAVTMHDEEWFWWIESDELSDIHRKHSWANSWRDEISMRMLTEYSDSPEQRNERTLLEVW